MCEWGANKFQFEFATIRYKIWVMDRHPWIITKDRPLNTPIEDIDFSNIEMWVQAHGLLLSMITIIENAFKIRKKMDQTIKIDKPASKLFSRMKVLRFIVEILVYTSLFASFFESYKNKVTRKYWVQNKYGRLFDFYYKCA